MGEFIDYMWTYCPHCDEEYNVPEEMTQCPICGEDIEEV